MPRPPAKGLPAAPIAEFFVGLRLLKIVRPMRMLSVRKKNGAEVLLGVAVASFCFHLHLWAHFMDMSPRHSQCESGLTYAMNSHGWYYYLSAAQAAQISICFYIFVAGVIGSAVFSRDLVVSQKMPWERYARAAQKPNWSIIWVSAILWTAILATCSFPVALFVTNRGLVLAPF
jgi:small-conductance mechanosensitive channel